MQNRNGNFAIVRRLVGIGIVTLGLAIAGCVRPPDDSGGHVYTAALAHVTDENFDAVVLGADGPVVVDCYATWCGPCQIQGPLFEEAAAAVEEGATFAVMDVDAAPKSAERCEVYSIPTLLVFYDGEVRERLEGVHQPKDILRAVQPYIQATAARQDVAADSASDATRP